MTNDFDIFASPEAYRSNEFDFSSRFPMQSLKCCKCGSRNPDMWLLNYGPPTKGRTKPTLTCNSCIGSCSISQELPSDDISTILEIGLELGSKYWIDEAQISQALFPLIASIHYQTRVKEMWGSEGLEETEVPETFTP
ncbi:MAG: hypothetical protein HWE25_09445 [Alphaproteobacteria bacterium]|nr:hypothetical protein [Alphaproteobacteria bacterium]